MHFIRPESCECCRLSRFQGTKEKIPLRASTLCHWSLKAHAETQKASLCDHNAVVNAEPVSRLFSMSCVSNAEPTVRQ